MKTTLNPKEEHPGIMDLKSFGFLLASLLSAGMIIVLIVGYASGHFKSASELLSAGLIIICLFAALKLARTR